MSDAQHITRNVSQVENETRFEIATKPGDIRNILALFPSIVYGFPKPYSQRCDKRKIICFVFNNVNK
jgi:hypothetical protein